MIYHLYFHIYWELFDNCNIMRIYSNYITYTVCYSGLYFEPKLANIL